VLEQDRARLPQYRGNPVGYAEDVLKVHWWDKQKEIAQLLHKPPYKVLALSAHGIGKTNTCAGIVNYWYDTHDPCAVITTAPTDRDVKDLLWSEIRRQRRFAGLPNEFTGPKAPELWSREEHLAKGFTSNRGESFQGRHLESMLFIMDEAVGIDPIFWETTKTMFQSTGQHGWVCAFNPTDTATQAYQEYLTAGDGYPESGWHVVSVPAIDHPNIALELAGKPPLIPGAVRLSQLQDWVKDWCDIIPAEDAKPGSDFEWPPGSGVWHRPGPRFESRAGGMWPSQGTYSVWSNWAWNVAEKSKGTISRFTFPELGCDCARFGDDFTSIFAHDGGVAIHHETHNGWSLDRTAGRLKQLCSEMVAHARRKNPDMIHLRPQQIKVKIDVDGMGAGLQDMRADYSFVPVSAACTTPNGEFKNTRSLLWFHAFRMARDGNLHLGRLTKESLALLRQQAMSPLYKINARGQLEVESKDDTKKRLKRSPDDMDSLNLSVYNPPTIEVPPLVDSGPRPGRDRLEPSDDARQRERGLFR
jgi:hypothetical protein